MRTMNSKRYDKRIGACKTIKCIPYQKYPLIVYTKGCIFCDKISKIEHVYGGNLYFFDDNRNVKICEKHIKMIHKRISEGKV